MVLAAEILGDGPLAEIPHQGVVIGIGNCDVVAGVRKVFEQMFHVSHGSFGREALNNMMGRLPNDSPGVPTALGLSRKCSCGFAKRIRRY